MSLIRRRYYFWLIRAYISRWRKTIVTSVVLGVIAFFIFIFFYNFYLLPSAQKKNQKIGYVGVHTLSTIPQEILSQVSYGLTRVDEQGNIKSAAAYRWQVKNDGKEYVFYLKKGQRFHNNKELTAKTLDLMFKDAAKRIIDDYTVAYSLREPYAPFLTLVSKPILIQNLAGLGEYKIKKVDLNAGFVRYVSLIKKSDPTFRKTIYFYPTQEALKIAYALGEIDTANGVRTLDFKEKNFDSWTNTKVDVRTNYKQLILLFYNNSDKILSDKRARQALNYALPESFNEGQRAFSPIQPRSVYFTKPPNYGILDTNIAKNIINDEEDLQNETLEISVLDGYQKVAEKVKQSWKQLGIKSDIRIVNRLPDKFQILLYAIRLPADADQYVLWHSDQPSNISKYKNLRIDKLLEDGRSIDDQERRISIYSDFVKYLIDDVPVSFLYFPYDYTLSRR